jgi:hypothetical protein
VLSALAVERVSIVCALGLANCWCMVCCMLVCRRHHKQLRC